ncbi:hypothetical protein MJ257_01950 [Paenibacillus timonensis]|uniref:TVP38/TMEM64 family protein n=1 Tax=Paenibacillus timonensis TaxID=225915 RepID=A0ABW3SA42_9BACL|nr:hypothetical protein [Paenibacillus timonensis]MCH1638858.1 hypothetical protein [Paenibacillus timonensis]
MLQAENVAEWLARWGIGAYLLSIILNVVISILGVIPSVFLTMANVLVFGGIPGFFVSWIGEMAGAIVSYLLYRKGALKLEEKYLSMKVVVPPYTANAPSQAVSNGFDCQNYSIYAFRPGYSHECNIRSTYPYLSSRYRHRKSSVHTSRVYGWLWI